MDRHPYDSDQTQPAGDTSGEPAGSRQKVPPSRPPSQFKPWLVALAIVGGIFVATLLFASMMTSAAKPAASSPTTPSTQSAATARPTSAAPSQTNAATKTIPSSPVAAGSIPACAAIGQTWKRANDQAVMMCVPAGNFAMGLAKCEFIGCEKEVNGGSVNLPAYWIDQNEVTNDMFQAFVQKTNYSTDAERLGYSTVNGQTQPVQGANWHSPQGPGSSIANQGNHPAVQINWFAANAYCKWAGGRLPSEAEWEKAARGTDGRLWPWGNTPPTGQLVNAADKNLPFPQANTGQNDGYRYTSPVGSYPSGKSPYGLADMAGNAWEWTNSLYKDYPYNSKDGREIEDQPAPSSKVVMRGGSWFDDYGSLRSTLRYPGIPNGASDGTGFRCVIP